MADDQVWNERTVEYLVSEIEKNIDGDKARSIFKYAVRNQQFKEDLDFSQSHIPKTLPALLKSIYSSDAVSQDSCTSSLKGLPNVIDEDGRISVDQTLSLFAPPTDFTKNGKHHYNQSIHAATDALASYNEKEGAEFELVAPVQSNFLFVEEPVPEGLVHVNFLAKPKNSDSSVELFFAELVGCGPSARKVLKCCILTPRFSTPRFSTPRFSSYSPVAKSPDYVNILHPEEVVCNSCRRH